jgi:hypothetical protein
MFGMVAHEDFTPRIGTAFTIRAGDFEEVLTLVEVQPGKPVYEGAREPFSLLFDGSRDDVRIESQTVPLDHDEMGRLDILISPIARNENGTVRYEAIFN